MDLIEPFRNRQGAKKKGFRVSRNVVRQLLKKHGYVKRKAKKNQRTGEFKERDRQFKKITRLKAKYDRADNPVISIDCKKKEKLGNLYREGPLYCLEAEVVYDHDYAYLSEGTVIPHGIYDLKYNEVTFEESRRHLGVETQRQWSDLAIARTTPVLLGLLRTTGGLSSVKFDDWQVDFAGKKWPKSR